MQAQKVTVEADIAAIIADVWRACTIPKDIMQWNAASDTWHTTSVSVDLRVGGAFSSRMEAKDGSFGFDFAGVYTKVVAPRSIEYSLGDRTVEVAFAAADGRTKVRITFDVEAANSAEQQRAGWQAILDNFARYVVAKQASVS